MENRITADKFLTFDISLEVKRMRVIPIGNIIAATVCSPINEARIAEIDKKPNAIPEVLFPVIFKIPNAIRESQPCLIITTANIREPIIKKTASMAVAALITCTLFSTATGIIGAVVTLMGLLAWPAMVKAGYDKKFASGIICAGGCLGILIPPSIMLIVYSVIAQLSPLRLFAAAIFPGLMLAGLYIAYAVTRAWLNL